MATAKQDYVRFLRWLHGQRQPAPEDVRRFANIVLADFDGVAPTAQQRHARSAHLATLARRVLAQTTADMPDVPAEAAAGAWPWRRLRSLTVGPFRGFRREEAFDLRKRVLMFYGPNGSGKTSLCEALERALMGSVDEAGHKRIDEAIYLRNIHAGRFAEPRLLAVDADGREAQVVASADLYRFCFVEKNRIDAFSRIAARPPAQRTELIATLFGMEKFNEFSNRFNDAMDPELTLEPRKQNELRLKREALTQDQATDRGEAAALAALDATDGAWAATYAEGTTFEGLRAVIGTPETPGRLRVLDDLLHADTPIETGVSRASLAEAYRIIGEQAEAWRVTDHELGRRASQVSFQALYTSVAALRETIGESCPACDTPIDRVARNPFEKAAEGLRELRDLADLQERQRAQGETLRASSVALRAELGKIQAFLDRAGRSETAVAAYLGALPAVPRGDAWWMDVYAADTGREGRPPSIEQILVLADEIATADVAALRRRRDRDALVQERDVLLERRRQMDERDLVRRRVAEDATAARQRIRDFETANARLIADATQERLDIERDRPIKAAYDRFLPALRRFRNELPGMLVAGLNDLAMELYNEFNHLDREEDKLAALHLPLTVDQRIEIAFKAAPQRRVDALAVLSEGHIRCLGLAILLAKSLSAETPLIIFDDAINAIDHDHRSGIRQTIFEGDRFANTQIVVTCHSHEFIKDAQNSLSPERRQDALEYLLLHHDGDHHPRVRPDVGSSAYLMRARQSIDRFDSRDALSHCRKALEMLSKKSWNWLKSHEVGEITVLVGGPGHEPNLQALCQGLRKKLRETQTFAHASKQPLQDSIEALLGIPSNLIWNYLNKGTHEESDREDFDREHVALVVATLERIEGLELRPGR